MDFMYKLDQRIAFSVCASVLPRKTLRDSQLRPPAALHCSFHTTAHIGAVSCELRTSSQDRTLSNMGLCVFSLVHVYTDSPFEKR